MAKIEVSMYISYAKQKDIAKFTELLNITHY